MRDSNRLEHPFVWIAAAIAIIALPAGCTMYDDGDGDDVGRPATARNVCDGHASCDAQPIQPIRSCEYTLSWRLDGEPQACIDCLLELSCAGWATVANYDRLCDLCHSCDCRPATNHERPDAATAPDFDSGL